MINLKYKIVEVNTNEHSIVVRYYTDITTEEMLAVDTLDGVIRRCRTDYSLDLPVPAPSGADLDTFIVARAPVVWFETQQAVANPSVDTSLSSILPLLNVENSIQTDSATVNAPATMPVTTL
jgi:hypothetical protein